MQLLSRICAVLLSLCAAVDAELDPAVYQRLQQSIERGQLAVIEDADGYVNVRSEPDSKSKPVLKIQKDEFFICEPSEAVWWSVSDFFGNEGFVHRSRIRLVKDLADADLNRLLLNPPVAPDDELEQRLKLYDWQYKTGGASDRAIAVGDLQIPRGDQLLSDAEHKQHLYLSYYTDGLLPTMLLFASNPPDAVLAKVLVYKQEGPAGLAPVSLAEARGNWPKLVEASNEVAWLNFKTVRGLAMGDDIEKVTAVFGAPHQRQNSGDVEIYRWEFPGRFYFEDAFLTLEVIGDSSRAQKLMELFAEGKKIELDRTEITRLRELLRKDNGRVLKQFATSLLGTKGLRAVNGCGFSVTAFARNGKLIALEYNEGIP